MSITTTPVFYYGFSVSINNIYLNFNEGGIELTGIVTAGNYSFTELGEEIQRVLSSAGGQIYSVTTDRVNRTYTISADSDFSLLFDAGSNSGLSVGSVIGFDGDFTGTNTYTGVTCGSEYIPQFPLQNFVGSEDYTEYANATISESASGIVETFSAGLRNFMEFSIGPVTNNKVTGLFRQSDDAVGDLRNFMIFGITKANIEYMKDETNRNSYQTIILDKTPTSSTGTGFKLKELYSRNLQGFFETGTLKFRIQI